MTPSSAAEIAADIARLTALLDEAASEAETGALIDLQTLDTRIDLVCRAALALPAIEARTLADELERLSRALNRADHAMRTRHETLRAATEGRMDPHTARRRARAAYGEPPSNDPREAEGDDEGRGERA